VTTLGVFGDHATARCEEFRQIKLHRTRNGADLNGPTYAPPAMHRELFAQCAGDTSYEQRTARFVA
jgi:hypothetical protein